MMRLESRLNQQLTGPGMPIAKGCGVIAEGGQRGGGVDATFRGFTRHRQVADSITSRARQDSEGDPKLGSTAKTIIDSSADLAAFFTMTLP
jgi:hypothetical protein